MFLHTRREFLLIFGLLYLIFAYSSGIKANTLLTDNISYEDSIKVGSSSARFSLTGMYPNQHNNELSDSIRLYLFNRIFGENQMLPDGILEDGKKLACFIGQHFLTGQYDNLCEGINNGELYDNYKDISFNVSYESDGVVTYNLLIEQDIDFLHRYSLTSQSFSKIDGSPIIADYIFNPNNMSQLMEAVKEALWNQYFKNHCGPFSDTPPASLEDAIDVDELHLPYTPPHLYRRRNFLCLSTV